MVFCLWKIFHCGTDQGALHIQYPIIQRVGTAETSRITPLVMLQGSYFYGGILVLMMPAEPVCPTLCILHSVCSIQNDTSKTVKLNEHFPKLKVDSWLLYQPPLPAVFCSDTLHCLMHMSGRKFVCPAFFATD